MKRIGVICSGKREYREFLSKLPYNEWHKYWKISSMKNLRGMEFSEVIVNTLGCNMENLTKIYEEAKSRIRK